MPEIDEQQLDERLTRLQERIEKFQISSSGLVSVVGTLRTGLAVNIDTGIVSPGGGPPPTVGACCFSNGSCAIQTADECSSLGGTYQGDNTTCSPNPCGCPTVTLVCDSVSVEVCKCGFSEFQQASPPLNKLYLTKTVQHTTTTHNTTNNDSGWINCDSTYTTSTVTTDDPTNNCNGTDTCSGSWSYTSSDFAGNPGQSCSGSIPNCATGWVASCSPGGVFPSPVDCPAPDGSFTCSNSGPTTTITPTTSETDSSFSCSNFFGDTANRSDTQLTTLSNEYTTAMLKSNTVAALPAFSGTFTGSCSASAELSSDETCYSISQFIPKFILNAPAPGPFTIHYNEHFVPDVGAPSNTARTLSGGLGATQLTGPQVDEPSSNGTITITDIVVTCP